MTATTGQRTIESIGVGDELDDATYPVSVYRLVMAAGSNRDFNSIHHNTEYAHSTGADEMYASTFFLQGMWERAVRDYIGDRGTIRSINGFRMKRFNYVGHTVVVKGRVTEIDPIAGAATIEIRSEVDGVVTVGPGLVVVTLPSGAEQSSGPPR
jgi:acyl dehydratase